MRLDAGFGRIRAEEGAGLDLIVEDFAALARVMGG